MNHRIVTIVIILSLALFPILSNQASALDLEGESSKVTVRSNIHIHSDGLLSLNFKVIWGESEFEESNIFKPKAYPPVLPWSDLAWENLSSYITPIATIRYLFESELPDGKTMVESQEHFVTTVLDIDVSFTLRSVKPRILAEFQTIEIRVEIEPSESSYTISPLKFLSDIDFHGYPPVGEVDVETGPSIALQSTSIALNHFLLPEGHRFQSEGLFSIEHSMITYDTSEDSIHVRKLPPVMSSTLLYSIWIGAAFLSMIILSVAARRARKRVNKGMEMWFCIGLVCFLAFLPFHLYLSLLLIIIGFYHSLRKSRSLKPTRSSSPETLVKETLNREGPVPDAPSRTGDDAEKERVRDAERPLRPEDIKALIPPPLPLSQTIIQKSDAGFAPPSLPLSQTTIQKSDAGFAPSTTPGGQEEEGSSEQEVPCGTISDSHQPHSITEKVGSAKAGLDNEHLSKADEE